jgi:hypothetical protein
MTWPPSSEVTRVIGMKTRLAARHFDDQADDPVGPARDRGTRKVTTTIAHPPHRVAERVEDIEPGQDGRGRSGWATSQVRLTATHGSGSDVRC